MSQHNDENTRLIVRQGHDQVSSFLSHFTKSETPTWDDFYEGSDDYLDFLRLRLTEMLHCVEVVQTERRQVEPTEFGS